MSIVDVVEDLGIETADYGSLNRGSLRSTVASVCIEREQTDRSIPDLVHLPGVIFRRRTILIPIKTNNENFGKAST